MLGAAGAGKTTEAERLASHESALGRRVRRCRLAEFADTSAELGEQLATLSAGASKDTVLYLDALDEAMIPARRRWLAIKHLIANKLHGTGTAIRITCRPAVWPRELSDVVGEFAGHESFATAFLHPLDDDDIGVAAVSLGIDPEAFLERLESTRARSLAVIRDTLRRGVCGGSLRLRRCGQPAATEFPRLSLAKIHEEVNEVNVECAMIKPEFGPISR